MKTIEAAAPRPSAPPSAAARPAPIPAADTAEAPADAGPPEPAPEPTPASSPATPALPAPTGAAASGGDLESVLAAWPAIVERLSAHPPTKPLILKCRPVAVDGAIVTLGFPEEQAFLKDQAERRRPGIEAGIAEVLGHPVTVRCVVANIELAPAGSDDLVAEARRIFADDLADVGEVS